MKLGIIATQIADDAGIASFFDDVPAMRTDMKELGSVDFGRKSGTFARPGSKSARAGGEPVKRPARVAPAKSARRRP